LRHVVVAAGVEVAEASPVVALPLMGRYVVTRRRAASVKVLEAACRRIAVKKAKTVTIASMIVKNIVTMSVRIARISLRMSTTTVVTGMTIVIVGGSV
jgi:hypothetical protein